MPQLGRVDAHKVTHQNGGSDEISVAGLSGALADAQTAAAHKASHQSGGSDEINATGLVGRVNYVDRGDPSAFDFTQATLTINAAWHDLDLSSIVPAGAKAVHLAVWVNDNATYQECHIRSKGNVNEISVLTARTQVANIDSSIEGIVAVGATRVVQYLVDTGTNFVLILVKGWFI